MRIDGMDRKRIASADEVLQFLTAVMRGDEKDEKGATLRMKAAEMISRRLGYEEAGDAGPAAVIVDDIGGTGDGEAVSQ